MTKGGDSIGQERELRMRLRPAGKNEQDEERVKDPQDAEEAGEVRTIFHKPSFPGGSLVADSLREALNKMGVLAPYTPVLTGTGARSIVSRSVRPPKKPHAVGDDEQRRPHVRGDPHPEGDHTSSSQNEKHGLGPKGEGDVEPDDPKRPASQANGDS